MEVELSDENAAIVLSMVSSPASPRTMIESAGGSQRGFHLKCRWPAERVKLWEDFTGNR